MNYGFFTNSKSKKTVFYSAILGLLLTLSSMAAQPAHAATTVAAANPSVPQGQWIGSEGTYPYNWNWSNQTQIGPNNLNQLQVNWVYPTPPTPSQYLAYNSHTTVPIGITFTGSIVNGIAYVMTQYMLIQAMNAHTGALIWQAQLPNMKFNCMANNISPTASNLTGHFHSIWYTSGVKGVWANTPMIWVMGSNHTAFAYNALTGTQLMHWQTYNPCAKFASGATGVPGNFGVYDATTQNAVFDPARGIMVTGSSDAEGVTAGRGFYVGYNISVNPPKQMWMTFIQPPQDGSQPNWDISDVANMTHAWIYDGPNGTAVNLKTLPAAQLQTLLYDDWGFTKSFDGTHSWAGTGTSWGGNWAMDPASGNAFVATSQPGPWPNATVRPGPDLWSNSVFSINDATGVINWAFQTNPHEQWDQDCSWTDMFATINYGGVATPAVIKTCKGGHVWALSAATGALLWFFFPGPSDLGYNGLPNSVCNGATSCTIQGTNLKASLAVQKYDHLFDPLNRSEMTRGWPNAPSIGGFLYEQADTEMVGGLDPTTNTFFYVAANNVVNTTRAVPNWGLKACAWNANCGITAPAAASTTPLLNATVWAVDANTGKPLWQHFIPALGFRGGLSATNGMILVPLDNGSLLFLNEQTGALLRNLFIGSAMVTQAMVGTDATGKTAIILPAELPITAGVYKSTGRVTSAPGFMFSVALGPAPILSTVTSTSTVPGAPTTSTATQTVTSSGSSTIKTVTSTGAASIATVISTTGMDPTTFYAVAALAVIFVIAAGFLALRGRKSAAT